MIPPLHTYVMRRVARARQRDDLAAAELSRLAEAARAPIPAAPTPTIPSSEPRLRRQDRPRRHIWTWASPTVCGLLCVTLASDVSKGSREL